MDEHERILQEMEARIVSHEEGMEKLRQNYEMCARIAEARAAERKIITAGLPRYLVTPEHYRAFNGFVRDLNAGKHPEIKGYRVETSVYTEVTYYCSFDRMEMVRYDC